MGEAIIVRSSSGVITEVISKEGFHFLYMKLVPGAIQVDKIRLVKRTSKATIRKELSGGLFPEMGDEGYLTLSFLATYSILPENLDEIFSVAEGSEENISKNVGELIQYKFSNTLNTIYKDPNELPVLRNRIVEYTEKTLINDLNDAKTRAKGFVFEDIRISRLDLPDPKVYLRLFAGTDLVIRSRIERANASIRGEGNAIEQEKKDEAYFKRLEKTALILKKFPELKEFALTDRLSDKVQVIAVPNEKYTGDLLKEKIKPKQNPKVIE